MYLFSFKGKYVWMWKHDQSRFFTANCSVHEGKYKFYSLEDALKQCCHIMYYLVIFFSEIGWVHPLRGWNETACSNYNKNHQGTLCNVTKEKVKSAYTKEAAPNIPSYKMNHKSQQAYKFDV